MSSGNPQLYKMFSGYQVSSGNPQFFKLLMDKKKYKFLTVPMSKSTTSDLTQSLWDIHFHGIVEYHAELSEILTW